MKTIYPFSAVVGQNAMKTALLIAAIEPSIGGVLIRGHKGTGKTTLVRALPALLPPLTAEPADSDSDAGSGAGTGSKAGAAGPVPMVELPLNATEDRLVGSLRMESALLDGERVFEPGILSAAHRGILYVDEVNLLEDHLVDMLLDAAASGVNKVEREGISHTHPSSFILIGTMNPEEGELRPQFLDRFGLCVSVTGIADGNERKEIIRRRIAFERDPEAFAARWEEEEKMLGQLLSDAKKRLPSVKFPEEGWDLVVRLSTEARTHGHRADITMAKAAAALAALMDEEEVTRENIIEAARFALPHRALNDPFKGSETSEKEVDEIIGRTLRYSRPESAEESGVSAPVPTGRRVSFSEEAEAMQVPGSMAAGSMLISYLKKKLQRS